MSGLADSQRYDHTNSSYSLRLNSDDNDAGFPRTCPCVPAQYYFVFRFDRQFPRLYVVEQAVILATRATCLASQGTHLS